MNESYSQIALTLLAPYVAWIAAERLHSSAVLACVAGGLYVRQHFSAEVAPLVRVQSRTVWELLIFLLNGIIFILIGLQLGPLRRTLAPGSVGQVAALGSHHHAHRDRRAPALDARGRAPGADRPEVPADEPACRPPAPSSSSAGRECAASCRSPRHSRFR